MILAVGRAALGHALAANRHRPGQSGIAQGDRLGQQDRLAHRLLDVELVMIGQAQRVRSRRCRGRPGLESWLGSASSSMCSWIGTRCPAGTLHCCRGRLEIRLDDQPDWCGQPNAFDGIGEAEFVPRSMTTPPPGNRG